MEEFALGSQRTSARLKSHTELAFFTTLVHDLGEPLWPVGRGLVLASFAFGWSSLTFSFGVLDGWSSE